MPVAPDSEVPPALRGWFVFHCVADLVFALPLFFAPEEILRALGFIEVDPLTTRLAAAALLGIGIESWLGRNAAREAFIGMLQLKIIWSGFATVGLAWASLEGNLRAPFVGWLVAGLFAAFHALWWYWRLRLGRPAHV